ncbi:CoA pyrophosphatase [Planctomonas sp. JC2975]|uniref:NUDIX hydrolase n=1 Tax=Planctomonas sp. JC2975 TaxID=2729626 RepID=UPI00147500D9|nr:CoA pyrophosphatase [Planctomonas sp. JC2975]NNC11042.1 CoA pyrophosphatase [Planctomonas sp. JC2975]
MSETEAEPVAEDALDELRALAHGIRPLPLPAAYREFPATRPASVLILFSPRDAPDGVWRPTDLNLLLQLRSSTLREHAGQVSFPGGRREPADAGPEDTALREAAEETGVDPSAVEVLSTLPALPLPVSDHLVTPVIGWWPSPSPLTPIDHAETTKLWQVPVAHLLDPTTRFTAVVERSFTRFATPAFDVDGTVVWGFTAMVLDRLFDAVGWALPWDDSRTRTIAG